jgi:hypothetical protein
VPQLAKSKATKPSVASMVNVRGDDTAFNSLVTMSRLGLAASSMRECKEVLGDERCERARPNVSERGTSNVPKKGQDEGRDEIDGVRGTRHARGRALHLCASEAIRSGRSFWR